MGVQPQGARSTGGAPPRAGELLLSTLLGPRGGEETVIDVAVEAGRGGDSALARVSRRALTRRALRVADPQAARELVAAGTLAAQLGALRHMTPTDVSARSTLGESIHRRQSSSHFVRAEGTFGPFAHPPPIPRLWSRPMATTPTSAARLEARPETVKREVVEELGLPALLLPSLLQRGLEANDRAKYLLSLLQAARSHADDPSQPWLSLREERLAARMADAGLDTVIERSRRAGPDLYAIPGASRLHQLLVEAVREMLAPFDAAGALNEEWSVDTGRLDQLLRNAAPVRDDELPGHLIDELTSARRDRSDSVHLLVMDAHRGLIHLHAEIAAQSVEGAAVYELAPGDPELVAAFMTGVHETSPLRFDHPGLGTSATRSGSRLLIQNDLGTTNAHVVVVTVEDLVVTITYSDVHARRLQFFASLFDRFEMSWSHAQARSSSPSLGSYTVTTGSYRASETAALRDFLRHAGAQLVFVLDWNRARKRLRTFVATKDAIAVLRWAAESRVGHIAWLQLGGERLIYDAVELAAKVPARYGEPLIDVLGREQTLAVTRFALRAASEGMLAGKSPVLIRDELRVEVLRHLEAAERRLLDASAEHASTVVECAQALHAALMRLAGPDGTAFLARAAARAARLEHRADEILSSQRDTGRRVEAAETVTGLTAIADDAIDALEEAVFLLTLLPAEAVAVARPILEPVAAIAVMTAREHFKAVEIARRSFETSSPDDLEDFLVAIDRVATLEHEADHADRLARAALVTDVPDFRSLYLADSVSRGAEDATDALLRSALGLRDHVLNALSAR